MMTLTKESGHPYGRFIAPIADLSAFAGALIEERVR
jgi:hypothetical protein